MNLNSTRFLRSAGTALLSAAFLLFNAACSDSDNDVNDNNGGDDTPSVNPVALKAPEVSVANVSSEGFTIRWNAVENATYTYRFDDGEEVATDLLSADFSGLTPATSYTFSIKSVSTDPTAYLDSGWADYLVSTGVDDEPDDPDRPLDLDLSAAVAGASFSGVRLAITAGADVRTVEYAVGNFQSRESDLAAFEAGTMPTGSAAAADEIFVADDSGAPVVIYLRGVSSKGRTGETCTVSAMSAPVSLNLLTSNVAFLTASTTCYDPDYSDTIGLAVFSQEALLMFGYEPEVAFLGKINDGSLTFVGAESTLIELAGYPDYDYVVCLQFYDKAGNQSERRYFDYTSISVDPSVPQPDQLDFSVTNVTESSASVRIIPGGNTAGYYYNIYTKEDYDYLYERGSAYDYSNPDDYIGAYTAFIGYIDFRAMEFTWSGLDSGAEYAAVGIPFNVNGSKGYGPYTIVHFRTGEAASAPAAARTAGPGAARVDKHLLYPAVR